MASEQTFVKCQECGEVVNTLDAVIYNEEFAVCNPCHKETEDGWSEMKKMLAEQGIKCPCDWIERQV